MNFDETAMRKLLESDRYLRFVADDLLKRNSNMNEREVLEVVFNSNILCDSLYMKKYKSFLQGDIVEYELLEFQILK